MARILIVDDEPSIVMAVRDELLFEGFEVESAVEADAAVDVVGGDGERRHAADSCPGPSRYRTKCG